VTGENGCSATAAIDMLAILCFPVSKKMMRVMTFSSTLFRLKHGWKYAPLEILDPRAFQ